MSRWNYATEATQNAARRRTKAPKLAEALSCWHGRFYLFASGRDQFQVWDARGSREYGPRWMGPYYSERGAVAGVEERREIEERYGWAFPAGQNSAVQIEVTT